MKHIAKSHEDVFVRSMGKSFRIMAIFDNDTEANEYMEKHEDAACIAVFGPFIICANKWESGRYSPGNPKQGI